MSYSVQYQIDFEGIPEAARRQIEKTMQQIAEVVSTVPPSSPFWTSLKESVLQIDIEGFRIGYRVDKARRKIRVIESHRVR